jgi:hypothetical protein
VALAIGIGLQNFPEGTAVAMPLRREGLSRSKSFYYGRLSAVVEPVAGVIGAAAVVDDPRRSPRIGSGTGRHTPCCSPRAARYLPRAPGRVWPTLIKRVSKASTTTKERNRPGPAVT